jgi:hypothetical protein
MNGATKILNSESITPAVHMEFIQNQLESTQPATPEQVEQYHRALFLHHHGPEWEKWRQEIKSRQDALGFLEGRLKETQLRLSERSRLVPVRVDGREDVQPTAPWNAWDVGMFIACCLGIVALITFGVLNISFNLLESGLITFRENPLRTYFWSALLPVGALAVKIGWDCLEDNRQRTHYLWSCLALGLLGVIVWVGAYACVYPTLSKGIDDQIAGLTVFDGTATVGRGGAGLNFAGAKWVDAITVAGQAMAEIFLSAVLGMYLTSLYTRHRPVRLGRDPAFEQLDEERRRIEESMSLERTALAHASGHVVRLENQLAALVAYGTSIFHREAARRQDQSEKKQIILDQLSEHLRQHLEGNGTAERAGRSAAGATLVQKNGG